MLAARHDDDDDDTEVWGRALLLSLDCSTLPLIRTL